PRVGPGGGPHTAVTSTAVDQHVGQTTQGAGLRHAKLAVAGLPAHGVTSVAHGLGVAPLVVGLEPRSNSHLWENAPADSTNISVGVGAASGTHAVDIYLTY